MSHHHGFRGGGALIEHRSAGDFHARKVSNERLEIEQCFQTPLRNLGLIRGVGGIPARVFENGALNDSGRVGAVVALADEVGEDLIGSGDTGEFTEGGRFSQRPRNGHGALTTNVGRHGGIDQRVERRHPKSFEHGSLFGCVRTIMATGEGIGGT